MTLASDSVATSLLVLLVQTASLLSLGLLSAWIAARYGPAWQTAIYRTTLCAMFLLVIAGPLFRITRSPGLHIKTPPAGPSIRWSPRSVTDTAALKPAIPPMASLRNQHAPETPAVAGFSFSPEFEPASAYTGASLSARDALQLAWISGVALLLLTAIFGQLWLLRVRKSSQPLAYSRAAALLEQLAAERKIVLPALVLCSYVRTPFVAGVRRPAIYLPATFEEHFEPESLRAIFSHELTHIQNRDCAWAILGRLMCCLSWPNPLVWLLVRKLTLASEELCDQVVLSNGLAAKDYARCLLHVAEMTSPTRTERLVGVGVFPARSTLTKRVALMLKSSQKVVTTLSLRARFGISATSALALVATSVLISAHRTAFAVPAGKTVARQAPAEELKDDPQAKAFLQTSEDAWGHVKSVSARFTKRNGLGQPTRVIDLLYKRPYKAVVTFMDEKMLQPEVTAYTAKGRFVFVSTQHPGVYLEDVSPSRSRVINFPWSRWSDSSLAAALNAAFMQGSIAAIPEESDNKKRALQSSHTKTYVSFGPDSQIDGVRVKTVIEKMIQPTGVISTSTYSIGASDHLFRRVDTIVPLGNGRTYATSQTVTKLKVNFDIADKELTFRPKPTWKRIQSVDRFLGAPSSAAKPLIDAAEQAPQKTTNLSFVDEEVSEQDDTDNTGKVIRRAFKNRLTVQLRKPLQAHMKLELTEYPDQGLELVSDGRHLDVTTGSNRKNYLEILPHAGDLRGFGGLGIPEGACRMGMEYATLAIKPVIGKLIRGEIGPPSVIDGEPVDTLVDRHVSTDNYGFPLKGYNETITYIGKRDRIIRRVTQRFDYEMKGKPASMITTETFRNVRIDEPIPDSEFVFKPRPGMTAVHRVPDLETVSGSPPPDRLEISLGDPVTPFKSTDIHGRPVTLDQFRGKVVLLHGWTFGIQNYVHDLPAYERLYEKYKSQGLVVIGIPFEDLQDAPQVLAYLKKQHIESPQVFDGKGRDGGIQKLFNLQDVMFRYVLDRHGRLFAKNPYGDETEKAIRAALARR